ncbi:MAG TPA: hypothetical protein VFN50_03150 [Acidimicrobiales bacterium]|nr:hypothetical protein [Acidimicrobiales bacterium]
MAADHTRPDLATEDAEQADAEAEHTPDRPPTPEEEEAAEQGELAEDVAEHYKEAIETGAEVKGEGEIA